jgi:hypothetical protein
VILKRIAPLFCGGDLRDFIDAILAFIGTTSLTNEEFAWFTVTDQEYTQTLYAEMILMLDSREAISSTRDRLTSYFEARGVTVTEPAAGVSKIFLGDVLE